MVAARRLIFLLHVSLSLANPSTTNFNYSKLNCTSLCGLPFDLEDFYYYRSRAHVSKEINRSVNLGARCVGESQLSIGNWEQSARCFLQFIDKNDTSFDCPKWNRAYREPNETELPRFWSKRRPHFLYSGKRYEYYPGFKTSVLDPAGIRGHCNITIDHGVIERNISVYFMGAEL